jgi:hypothetical protein
VSVTPAMGARTVAGEIVTVPIWRELGTGFRETGSRRLVVPSARELSQNLRMWLNAVALSG